MKEIIDFEYKLYLEWERFRLVDLTDRAYSHYFNNFRPAIRDLTVELNKLRPSFISYL